VLGSKDPGKTTENIGHWTVIQICDPEATGSAWKGWISSDFGEAKILFRQGSGCPSPAQHSGTFRSKAK